MAGIEVSVSVKGTPEALRDLANVGEVAKKAGQEATASQAKLRESTLATRGGFKDLIQTVSGTAAIMSLMARNNEEAQRKLEILSLSLSALSVVMRAAKDVISLLSRSMALLWTAGIAVVITGITLLIRNWEEAKAAAARIWSAVGQFFRDLFGGIAEMASGLGEVLKGAVTLDRDQINRGLDTLRSGWKNTGEVVGRVVEETKAAVTAGYDYVIDNFTNAAERERQLREQGMLYAVQTGAKTTRDLIDFYNQELAHFRGNEQQRLELIAKRTQAEDKYRKESDALSEQTMLYRVQIGQATLEQQLEFYKTELAFFQGTELEKVALMQKVAATESAIVDKRIQDIERMGGLTRSELITQLMILRDRMIEAGETGSKAFLQLNDRIKMLQENVGTFGQQIDRELKKRFEENGRAMVHIVLGIESAWENAFVAMATSGKKFKDIMDQLWVDIRNTILSNLAKVVANKVWQWIFGESLSGSGGGSSGGGFSWGSLLGLFGGSGASGSGGGGGGGGSGGTGGVTGIYSLLSTSMGGSGSILGDAGSALGLTSSTASTTTTAGASTASAGASFGGASLGFVGGFVGTAILLLSNISDSQARGRKRRRLLERIWAEEAAERERLRIFNEQMQEERTRFDQMTQGTDRGGIGFGDATTRFARGGELIVNRPTLLLAGENGAERVNISGVDGAQTRGGVNVNFNGPVVLDQITMSRLVRQLGRAQSMEGERYG